MELIASLFFVCVYSQTPCAENPNWIQSDHQRLDCAEANPDLRVRLNIPTLNMIEPMCSENAIAGCVCQVKDVYRQIEPMI